MKYITIDQMQPNMIIASYLYDRIKQFFIQANSNLTTDLIQKIKMSDYEGVYIYNNYAGLDQIQNKIYIDQNLTNTQNAYFAHMMINQQLNNQTIKSYLIELDNKDHTHTQHSIEVAVITIMIAISLNMSNQDINDLTHAALLHDIGKIKIPETILNKPGNLTKMEYEIMKTHTQHGFDIINNDLNQHNQKIADAILYHHENYNGSGYPKQLKGNDIPLYARILRIADTHQALTAKRVYKKAMPPDEAMKYMISFANTLFDLDLTFHLAKQIIHYPLNKTIIQPKIYK